MCWPGWTKHEAIWSLWPCRLITQCFNVHRLTFASPPSTLSSPRTDIRRSRSRTRHEHLPSFPRRMTFGMVDPFDSAVVDAGSHCHSRPSEPLSQVHTPYSSVPWFEHWGVLTCRGIFQQEHVFNISAGDPSPSTPTTTPWTEEERWRESVAVQRPSLSTWPFDVHASTTIYSSLVTKTLRGEERRPVGMVLVGLPVELFHQMRIWPLARCGTMMEFFGRNEESKSHLSLDQ